MAKFVSKKMIIIVIAAIFIFLGFNAYLFIDYLNFKNSDNLSDAEKLLQHIKDNPQEWGTISQRGTELINLRFPIILQKSMFMYVL